MERSCPECGTSLPADSRFCDSCGASLEPGKAGEAAPGTVIVTEGSPDTVVIKEKKRGKPEKFGRYRVISEIQRGAMGIVYLAHDHRIGRDVAIKTLHIDPGYAEEERKEIAERFNREAHAAGMLSHPNIVTIYDVGEEEGVPYIAMEYLKGKTLSQVIRAGSLSVADATDIVCQILSALEYAHGHEVVHRDIKPDNVFLLPDGRVKVADFGIAHVPSSGTMTQVGQIVGTPGYMSPEQVMGKPVGPSSDLFSVGVVFYELLTGVTAFANGTPLSISYRIVHDELEPLRDKNPDVPEELEAAIARSTAKNPSVRFGSARQMMGAVCGEAGVAATPMAGEAAVLPAEVDCPGCGLKTSSRRKFCTHCGTRLPAGPATQQVAIAVVAPATVRERLRELSPRDPWVILAACLVVLIVGGIIAGLIVIVAGGSGTVAKIESTRLELSGGESLDLDKVQLGKDMDFIVRYRATYGKNGSALLRIVIQNSEGGEMLAENYYPKSKGSMQTQSYVFQMTKSNGEAVSARAHLEVTEGDRTNTDEAVLPFTPVEGEVEE